MEYSTRKESISIMTSSETLAYQNLELLFYAMITKLLGIILRLCVVIF